jgi:hypothetical protein
MLWKLAEDQEENHQMDDIFWLGYKIKSMRIKLENVEGPEEEIKKIQDGFKAPSEDGYKDIPLSDNRLLRVGAFAQMISPSAFPIPLAGPATRTLIKLQGYADINPEKPQRQTETYELKRESETHEQKQLPNLSTWTGTYEVRQEELKKPNPKTALTITFHVKIVLEELGPEDLI